MKRERALRVVTALGKRISDQGDMHIRVHRKTIKVLLYAVGLDNWDPGVDDYREIDAMALDMLRHLAWQRLIQPEGRQS